MSHSHASSKTTHWLFRGEWQNFLYFHVGYGFILSLITTIIAYVILLQKIEWMDEYGFKVAVIFFIIMEVFLFITIEATREYVPPLSEVPVSANGTFTNKYAKQGSYLALWPIALMMEELISLQPKARATGPLKIKDGDQIMLIGGEVTYSYKVDENRSVHFTKNTEDNFIKELEARLTSELNTVVSKAKYGDDGSTITTGLEDSSKKLLLPTPNAAGDESNDVLLLALRSGVKIQSINIAPFKLEDEEDKDALAQKKRQSSINEGHKQKMKAFDEMVKEYLTNHPGSTQKDAEKYAASAMGIFPGQLFETSGSGGGTGATPVIVVTPKT